MRTGQFVWSDGERGKASKFLLGQDTIHSLVGEKMDEPNDVVALPDLPGRGFLYSLHQAMVRDWSGELKRIPPSGSKRWRLKYRIGGREKLLSLGLYPDVSLKQARERRDEARKLLAAGIDPIQERRAAAAAALTFRDVAEEWLAKRRDGLSARHNATISAEIGRASCRERV